MTNSTERYNQTGNSMVGNRDDDGYPYLPTKGMINCAWCECVSYESDVNGMCVECRKNHEDEEQ